MYLKSIKAQGFKSFADKIDLEIHHGITAIVGPNGSGKSNIVDAIRWVLGEQSVKSLRGSSNMSDCIFSGSESREAQKRAMVALTIDNLDHYLSSDFNEIEIKRVVYSTGENEYYLNNSRVRLKDITNLFLDSGAGASSFNIISQGNVTDIVNSKPEGRREIFESTAGVLKYKKRKEESLKKLEKTKDNLNSIKLVIDELETTIKPLKEQSIVAKKYKELKSELESIDIALLASDITNLNIEYTKLKKESDNLSEKLLTLKDNSSDVKLEKIKLEITKLEEYLNNKKDELIKINENISNLNSEKKLTLERQKYEVDNKKIDENILALKERELTLNKNITVSEKEVESINESINEERKKLDSVKNEMLVLKVKRSTNMNSLNEENKKLFMLDNKINILTNNILNQESSPVSVKNVLSNPRLTGIHNTIKKLITTKEEYEIALDIALSASSNYIVCDNENNALKAIEFLKEKRLGRATFYPLSIIKERHINNEVLNNIKNINGYIGIFSDLVSYDSVYQNIISNVLGTTLVVNNSSTLTIIGKLIDYKYKVISLDGEVLYPGGAINGGTSKKNSMNLEKKELNKLKLEKEQLQVDINNLEKDEEELNNKYQDLEERENVLNKYIILLNEELFNKKSTLSKNKEEYLNVTSELDAMNNLVNNTLDDTLVKIMDEINSLDKEKGLIETDIKKNTKIKAELNDNLNIIEKEIRDSSSSYNLVNNELKNKEVAMGKIEVKLDNYLEELSSNYNITYEYALNNYNLNIDSEIAREKVSSLKKDISSLGEVNTSSISEFERLNKRYEFLVKQRDDLNNASSELKTLITQMDDVMIEKFKTTFDKVKVEFSKVFKLMFKGGHGELALSNPEDLLNTGILITATPPGKKINSPLALSGGEKALTAICLLFAILKVKPSPFVILDEAEAALDEVNVDMFGKYLNEEKKMSQFIVITHKKRMMEYADCLYGITMQESGVSKIVSAKLTNN